MRATTWARRPCTRRQRPEIRSDRRCHFSLMGTALFVLTHVLLPTQHSCRLLLEAGALPNMANSIGNTPLHRAARNGNFDVAFVLLSTSCGGLSRKRARNCCLHCLDGPAPTRANPQGFNADRGIRSKSGKLPIDLANKDGHRGVAQLLANPPRCAQE